jgi:hypothetical protein
MANKIVQISARAKQIRKAHPHKKWQDCIKQASRELKGAGPKKTAKKKAVRRVAKKTSHKVRTVKRVSRVKAGNPKTALLTTTKEQLGKLYVQRDMATTKRDKKAIGKKISEKKTKLRLIGKL